MLETGEKWVGPYRIRKMLEDCLSQSLVKKAPDSNSCYIVTRKPWTGHPSPTSTPLYVGGNTGKSERFRTRLGDLLADMFGFYNSRKINHHSGGISLHQWCAENGVTLSICILHGSKALTAPGA